MNKPGARLQAIGGLVLDLRDLLLFRPRNPHSLSKFRQLRAVQRRTGAKHLLEAGTYLGVTAGRCAPHFSSVATWELDGVLFRQAQEHLQRHRNVDCQLANALTGIPDHLQRTGQSDVLIFLDGHFSGPGTASGDEPEPAVEALAALAPYQRQIAAVVIDDFREFGSEPGWPSKWELIKAAEDGWPDYRLVCHMDQVLLERRS